MCFLNHRFRQMGERLLKRVGLNYYFLVTFWHGSIFACLGSNARFSGASAITPGELMEKFMGTKGVTVLLRPYHAPLVQRRRAGRGLIRGENALPPAIARG